MGLLDDAIRDHLELKRKHGASEEEIVQAEQEALAPARRDLASEEPPPVDEPVFADQYGAEPAPADADEPPAALGFEEPAAEDDVTRVRPVISYDEEDEPAEPLEAPEPGTPKPHGDPALDEDDLDANLDDDLAAEDQLSAEPEPDPYRARTSLLDDPLADGPPPAVEPPPDGDAGQDVLEETPDFLQETPEHDKLWFEQKPPRDFDFD